MRTDIKFTFYQKRNQLFIAYNLLVQKDNINTHLDYTHLYFRTKCFTVSMQKLLIKKKFEVNYPGNFFSEY